MDPRKLEDPQTRLNLSSHSFSDLKSSQIDEVFNILKVILIG